MYNTAKHDNSWKQSYSIEMVSIKKVYIIMIVIKLRKMIIVQRIGVSCNVVYQYQKRMQRKEYIEPVKSPIKNGGFTVFCGHYFECHLSAPINLTYFSYFIRNRVVHNIII